MKRLFSIAAALIALAALTAVPASAISLGTSNPVAKAESDTIAVKGGRGHGRGHMKRHRGHHYGWSRGRHRGWR